MKERTREFLEKLHTLMTEYEVDITIEESCSGYSGFSADGLEIGVPYREEGYTWNDYVTLSGKSFYPEDIKELLEKTE